MEWGRLINERELAALLPGADARFAGPIREGLVVFLSGLSPQRQGDVLARQAALGLDASLSVRLGELARSCPLLHKLGQILARDHRLAPALREQFRPLERLEPAVPWRVIESELTRELGPLARRGVELLPPALAEASVAVVIPFRPLGGGAQGVLKLLKPGIEERLEEELHLLRAVGAHLDDRCDDAGLPALDYRDAFLQVHVKLASEVRLHEEQRHLETAAQLYAVEPQVHVPRLLPEYCTPRVTAMERVFGVPLTEHELPHSAARRRLARTLARAIVSRPLLSSREQAIIHCDPHSGNLLYTDAGRIAILDWSLVARLSDSERETLTQLLLAVLVFDEVRIVELMAQLSVGRHVDHAMLANVVRRWVERSRNGQMPGFEWLVGLFDDASLEAGLRASADLMLIRKSLLTLEGVLADVTHDEFAIDEAVVPDFLTHFASEAPTRWLAPVRSREFATRISNSDLFRLAWNWPLAALRWRLQAGG